MNIFHLQSVMFKSGVSVWSWTLQNKAKHIK